MITINPTIPGGSTLTFGSDPSITLSDSYNGGMLIDGSRQVIAPAGTKVVSASPAPATIDGLAGHGMQANIQLGGTQALDQSGGDYAAGSALDTALVYRPGDTIVKVKSSNPRLGTLGRAGAFDGTSVLHVVASAKPFAARAPIVWPSADLANRPWRVADVDGFLSGLPVLASTGAPTWAAVSAYWDKLDFGRAMTRGIAYQYLTPSYITNTDSAYDEFRAIVAGTVWGGICGNEWSTADKTAAVNRALPNGCQIAETYGAFGLAMNEDGGHFQSHQADCLAWLKATGQTSRYATLMPLIGGNIRGSYYVPTAGMFNPHDSASLPYLARRRTVSAITGSGPYVVTCTDYRPASGLVGDTASNAEFVGLNMIRESNSAVALITAKAGSGVGTGWQFTVAALPTGLIVGDVIYCGEVTPLAVGVAEFCIRNPTTYPNLPNPAPNVEYRSNNKHGNCLLPISAMGMRGSDLANAKSYVERIAASTSYGSGFQQTFWTAHQATVLALPQIV